MQQQDSVFRGLLKLVPWHEFNTDLWIFTRQMVWWASSPPSISSSRCCMVKCPVRIRYATSKPRWKAIRGGFITWAPRRRLAPPSPMPTADRDCPVFSGLCEYLPKATTRGFRRQIGEAVARDRIPPAYILPVLASNGRASPPRCVVPKPISCIDPDLGCPIYHMVTNAKVNDIMAAKQMPIEEGAAYVFDLGYYDYGWWAKLDQAYCRIVTRFKANTPLREPSRSARARFRRVERPDWLPA